MGADRAKSCSAPTSTSTLLMLAQRWRLGGTGATLQVGILTCRSQDLDRVPGLTLLCAGYEQKSWRAQQFVDDMFMRHLPSFALSYTQFQAINGDTAGQALKRAAHSVYATNKYEKRGEFGELILHGVARDFFGAESAVSKIFYKDSANDTVKGFDSVHVVLAEGEIEVWLGEVKFYSDLSAAIASATAELKLHLEADFLRKEFIAITNKLDKDWPHFDAFTQMLDTANSLDEIADRLVIPVLLTYNSDAVCQWDSVCNEYTEELIAEAEAAWAKFSDSLDLPLEVRIQLILVPVEDKARLQGLFHQKLKLWQHL